MFLGKNRIHTNVVAEGKYFPTLRELGEMSFTFLITVIAWVFFRADSISHALGYLKGIFNMSIFSEIEVFPLQTVFFILIFMVVEWLGRESQFAIERIDAIPKLVRMIAYSVILFAILVYSGEQQEFIYFQF